MNALDFVNMVSGELGWGTETDVASPTLDETPKILKATNAILKSLHEERIWPELTKAGTLEIEAAKTSTATGTVTFGSADVVLSAADAQFDSADGYLVEIGGSTRGFYRIESYTAGTPKITLESPWRGEDASGLEIKFAKDKYSLASDTDRIIDIRIMNLRTGNTMLNLSGKEMREKRNSYGAQIRWEEPEYWSVWGEDSSGNKVLHVDKLSEDPEYYTFEYQMAHPTLVANTTEILYPESHMLYIMDAVIARMQRNVDKGQEAIQSAQEALNGRVQAGKNPPQNHDQPRFKPKRSRHGAFRRR